MMEKKIREEAQKSGVHLIEKTQNVKLEPIETNGFILDLGGGEEGIIGKLNGNQVISIDKKIEELEEINNDSVKYRAWAVSIIVHVVVLAAFGLAKFSKPADSEMQKAAPIANVSRIGVRL